jgi:CRISPR-associated endonuclease/helicase Cas3
MDRPAFAWAKLLRDADRNVIAALPLIDHCLDVAAVAEALFAGGAWGAWLEEAAGRALTAQDIARLVSLIALHDLGKANAGFQRRWHPKAEPIGHEPQVAALLMAPEFRETSAAKALHALIPAWGATPYIPALMAHHGRPRIEFGPPPPAGGRNLEWQRHVLHWRATDGHDPTAETHRLIETVRARYPLAWQAGPPLPQSSRFIALFAGLVVLADWIGSDAKRFPIATPHGPEREALRVTAATEAVRNRGLTPIETPAADFEALFGFPPHAIQSAASADDLGAIALIEAETGSGKTEAALWRWVDLRRRGLVDGLYFALPTRSAAVQMHDRVQTMLKRLSKDGALEVALAVPGYPRAGEADGQALPGREVRWDDREDDSRWAAECSTQYLAARVAVGTIDQALLGALRVKHAPVRAMALARNLLVVDEVHASDAFMGRLLQTLLANHTAVGGHALLLSATLGAEARAHLLRQPKTPSLTEAEATPYPALSGLSAAPRPVPRSDRRKTVRFEVAPLIDAPEEIAAQAVAAARAGASVLVVRNTVAGAVAVAQAVEALAADLAFRVGDTATLHHGRFAAEDRRRLDDAVEAAFGKARTATGRVLVGTQTLEQSLDIDADLLVTDLAPMDVLLQRIGRLHRHDREERGAFVQARAIILRPAERNLIDLLTPARDRHGLGPNKDGRGVYPDLLQIEATLRLLESNPQITIPNDNRRLVENALHTEIREALLKDLGTDWLNHDAKLAGIAHAERTMAASQSLDLDKPFKEHVFPRDELIATRLGARDLLVDLPVPLRGPFGADITRIAIPHWMAGGITRLDKPTILGPSEAGQSFTIGPRHYAYGRWGLQRTA